MLSVEHLADAGNAAFMARLLPTVDPATILGARTPALRAFAKDVWRSRKDEVDAFLEAVPHELFDENMLHGLLVAQEEDFDTCLVRVEEFLPYVDNWAVCDSMNPRALAADLGTLESYARRWMAAEHVYTRRFGVGVMMEYFLGEAFRPEFLALVAEAQCDEYYVQMMIAWYFATAAVKQPNDALPWLVEDRLTPRVQRMAIQKCVESRRVPDEVKDLLREVRAGIGRD
ncbi:DNA alkylation repair protein [Schaalia vaccimaxillae]|uniref:DNA alkylation repair protein n=1 Tax=Schaalia vaccimaxillae TaxID=183916 RepID=UPI0003B37546|nr:DNA alkylation repair protein [Schaalia vaccimaxillae]